MLESQTNSARLFAANGLSMWTLIKNRIESVGSIMAGATSVSDTAAARSDPHISQRSLDDMHQEAMTLVLSGQCASAASILSDAVALRHPRSHADLSWLLLWGRDGLSFDYRKAFHVAQNGTQLGCVWSKGALAFCYLSGRGVAANEALGFDLASQSADTSYGQFCLGYAHFYGIGGAPKKSNIAMKYFVSAQDNAEALHHVGHMLENGIGAPPNKAEALSWYKAAAAQGCAAASSRVLSLLPRKVQKSALEVYLKQLIEN
jgi:TPR repeat protein